MNILNNLDNLTELNIKKITDKSNLYLLKYDRDKSDFTNDAVNEARGIILEKTTNKIICYSLNKMNKDFNEEDVNWSDCKVYEAIDGTQIRLYYYDDEWTVTTTRCINAISSSWNYMKSFYELYNDVEVDVTNLNKEYTYTFILKHIENRIVSKITKNELIHIHTRNNKTFEEVDEKIENIKQPILLEYENYEDLKRDLKNSTIDTRGYVIHYGNKKYLIETDEYKYVKELKGNHRNITYQYIDLVRKNKYDEYLEYYPEKKILFDSVKSQLTGLSILLHNYYMKKNIKKEIKFNDIPVHLRKIIYNLHSIHINERKIITRDIIYEYLHEQSPGYVINILKQKIILQKPETNINDPDTIDVDDTINLDDTLDINDLDDTN